MDSLDTRDRLLETLDMFSFGVDLMKSNLRRRYPNASSTELEHLLDDWLVGGPGLVRDGERIVTNRYK